MCQDTLVTLIGTYGLRYLIVLIYPFFQSSIFSKARLHSSQTHSTIEGNSYSHLSIRPQLMPYNDPNPPVDGPSPLGRL